MGNAAVGDKSRATAGGEAIGKWKRFGGYVAKKRETSLVLLIVRKPIPPPALLEKSVSNRKEDCLPEFAHAPRSAFSWRIFVEFAPGDGIMGKMRPSAIYLPATLGK
jgi:hypothetical protein